MNNKTLNEKRAKAIGKVLKSLRNELKLTQRRVANALDLGQEQLCRMELGTQKMSVAELLSYSYVLGVSPSELFERIEVALHSQGLLSPPKKLSKTANVGIETIMVDVSWFDNKIAASLPDVPSASMLTAQTFQGLQDEVEAFIESLSERLLSVDDTVPSWLLHKRYEFKYHFLDVTALLKAYTPLLTLTAISRATGISQSLLSQYVNGKKKARPRQLQRIVGGIHRVAKELMMVVS